MQLKQSTKHRFVGTIPIRNIWLLMLYASDLYRHEGNRLVSLEDNPEELPDLVAELLTNAVEKRLRWNLTYGYQHQKEQLNRVRGRIDILSTERHQHLSKGKIICNFEELSVNTTRNRYVLSALKFLIGLLQNESTVRRCRSLVSTLNQLGVSDNRPTRSEISTDRLGRNDSADRLMVSLAKLVFDMSIPAETDGNNYLFYPSRDEIWMRKLYEKAIGGFYSVKLPKNNWHVTLSKSLKWQIDYRTESIDNILPSMRTDVIIENYSEQRKIIIDTKFNSLLAKGWYRDETIRSAYLYQMYAYLMSQNNNDNILDTTAAGLLLHPALNSTIDETVIIQGHPIRFATVDLTASSSEISNRLLQLLDFNKF